MFKKIVISFLLISFIISIAMNISFNSTLATNKSNMIEQLHNEIFNHQLNGIRKMKNELSKIHKNEPEASMLMFQFAYTQMTSSMSVEIVLNGLLKEFYVPYIGNDRRSVMHSISNICLDGKKALDLHNRDEVSVLLQMIELINSAYVGVVESDSQKKHIEDFYQKLEDIYPALNSMFNDLRSVR